MLEKDKKNLEKEIIISFEKEGDKKTAEGNHLAANWFYNDALTAAKNFGFKEYYEKLKKKLMDSGGKIKYKEIKINVVGRLNIRKKLEEWKIKREKIREQKQIDKAFYRNKKKLERRKKEIRTKAEVDKIRFNEYFDNLKCKVFAIYASKSVHFKLRNLNLSHILSILMPYYRTFWATDVISGLIQQALLRQTEVCTPDFSILGGVNHV